MSLSWTASSDSNVTGYNVYRSTTSGSGYVQVNPSSVTGTTYTNPSLTDGTTYYYVVTAISWQGESSYSNEVNTTSTAPVALDAPIDLAVYATGSGKVTLYWSGVADATGYNIYRGTAAGNEDYAHPVNGTAPVTMQDASPGVTNMFQFSDTGLADGTEYFYTIKAVNGSSQSVPSNEDSDVPTSDAIPWDSSPAAIISKVHQTESNQPGLAYSVSYALLRVMGPDGVIYQDGVSNPLLPDGSISPSDGTMTLGGDTYATGPFPLGSNGPIS